MRVLDHERWSWFLLEQDGALFLDAYCNNSWFGYSWLIELNADERAAYAREGRAYCGRLAQDIHMGVPILAASTSPYKGRNRDRELGAAVSAAVKAWREGGAASAGQPAGT